MISNSSLPQVSEKAQAVLRLLRDHHNVLISGPVGTGKTRLLAELAAAFTLTGSGAGYMPRRRIAIPSDTVAHELPFLPSPHRKDREVFRTTFHAGTKAKDFLRGIVPSITNEGEDLRFQVTNGTLYRASEHGRTTDGAALLMIDELNRGPAVAVFGPSIVALEGDKRLSDDGGRLLTTQDFPLLDDGGQDRDYQLPAHLYVVAAVNQADTSVAGLDVAFLRRFAPYALAPDETALLEHFQLPSIAVPDGAPTQPADVWALLVAAWRKVNDRLSLARGPEYQIGHGPLMFAPASTTDINEALSYAARAWAALRQHIDEVFFGDIRGVAEMLAAGKAGSPYQVEDSLFGGQPVVRLLGPADPTKDTLVALLRAIAK